MIESATIYIQSVIAEYGARGVFLATIVEEVIAPIPSALVPLLSGFFLLEPELGIGAVLWQALVHVAFPVALGVCLGSGVVYAIAYYGGKPLIERSRRWLGIGWEDVESISEKFTKGRSDEITLFTLRLIPIIPGVALSGFCGVIRYPFHRFLTITFAGAILRAFFLGLLGWQAGEFYVQHLETIDRIEGYLLILLLLALASGIAGYHFFRRCRTNGPDRRIS